MTRRGEVGDGRCEIGGEWRGEKTKRRRGTCFESRRTTQKKKNKKHKGDVINNITEGL